MSRTVYFHCREYKYVVNSMNLVLKVVLMWEMSQTMMDHLVALGCARTKEGRSGDGKRRQQLPRHEDGRISDIWSQ